MIPQDTIEQIRQATDIAQIIGEYVRLKKRGKTLEANCPFHTEKTPSFKVNVDKQIYHCFGCGKGGNVFTFLMEHDKMSFIEAVKYLARRANIVIREEVRDERREQLEKLNYAHQVAVEYFQKILFSSQYRVVLDGYLRKKRSIEPETIEFFKLGLAGEAWDGLLRQAIAKGLTNDDMLQAGLAVYSENKKTYFDRFRQRLMIPIFNLSQKPIAFGGRTLKKGEPAKYVNSPETPLYSKGNVLYGLNFARDHIRTSSRAYIVEGYFDYISLWQAGVRNVVASSGTAFTPQQARLLARFCDEVYLFFDADSAGQNAALRSVDALYDAGLEVKVMIPPEGEDPDSVARKFGRDKIDEISYDALGYIPFRIKKVNLEHSGIIAKEKLVKELSSLAEKITDPTRRALFYEEAASALSIDRAIFQTATTPSRESRDGITAAHRNRQNKIETEFVSLLFCNPGCIDEAIESISPDDLDSKQLSRLYAAMIQQYRLLGVTKADKLVESFADEAMISLTTEVAALDWEPEQVEAETRSHMKAIFERKRRRIRADLQKELADAEARGDNERAAALLEQIKSFGL